MSLMILISLAISIGVIFGTFLLNKFSTAYAVEKLTQYECGFEPIEEKPGIETRERFYIKFYIIAIIFLIFDLEAILLYPFTTILAHQLFFGFSLFVPFVVFLVFMLVLVLGLIYEYKKGVLN
jgi:NADH:ubiquinone oxidoreductase subunit 3 (subunit A)